jgi:hypothetical protein
MQNTPQTPRNSKSGCRSNKKEKNTNSKYAQMVPAAPNIRSHGLHPLRNRIRGGISSVAEYGHKSNFGVHF